MSSVTFSTAVGGDGSTVTDDNNATTGLREGGWKTRFVPCFTQQVAVANYVVNTALTVLGGATTNSTSTTSLAIGTGSKSLTLVESGKAYIVGQYVIIASTASPSNNMVGQITSFSGTSLVVNVTTINGSGTISAWSISVTASPSIAAGGFSTLAIVTSSGTFTIPTGKTVIKVTVIGGGGGGAAYGGGAGGTGGTTSVASGTQTISTVSANGGAGNSGQNSEGALGGTASGGSINITGAPGSGGTDPTAGTGGSSTFGAGGDAKRTTPGTGGDGVYGGGGAGANSGGGYGPGNGGGGAGATAIKYLTNLTPGNTLTFTIGAGGAGATGYLKNGGAGGAGLIVVEY